MPRKKKPKPPKYAHPKLTTDVYTLNGYDSKAGLTVCVDCNYVNTHGVLSEDEAWLNEQFEVPDKNRWHGYGLHLGLQIMGCITCDDEVTSATTYAAQRKVLRDEAAKHILGATVKPKKPRRKAT